MCSNLDTARSHKNEQAIERTLALGFTVTALQNGEGQERGGEEVRTGTWVGRGMFGNEGMVSTTLLRGARN